MPMHAYLQTLRVSTVVQSGLLFQKALCPCVSDTRHPRKLLCTMPLTLFIKLLQTKCQLRSRLCLRDDGLDLHRKGPTLSVMRAHAGGPPAAAAPPSPHLIPSADSEADLNVPHLQHQVGQVWDWGVGSWTRWARYGQCSTVRFCVGLDLHCQERPSAGFRGAQFQTHMGSIF